MRELEATLSALDISLHESAALRRQLDTPRAVLYQHREVLGLRQISGGELLRALRVRSGTTQEDAARAIGVTREMLSRWERGEHWPDAQKLHALCFSLGASLDEALHLTTRGFVEPQLLPMDRNALLGIHASFAFDNVASPGRELFAWHLAARLAEIEKNDLPQQQVGQAAIWGTLSYSLWQEGNFAMAQKLSQQTEQLMRSCRRWLGSAQIRGILIQAEVEARREGPRAAIRYLETWYDQVNLPELRAWLYSVQSDYLLRSGESEASLQRSRQSLEELSLSPTSPGFSGETSYRWRDYARHLLQAGQPGKALEILLPLQTQGVFSERDNVPTLLLLSRASERVGSWSEALTYREKAQEGLLRNRVILTQEYQDI